jgi:hypothetical protein
MKDLITSAFPRSGSTYLNQALQLLFYPSDPVNLNRHSVIAIKKSEKIMVPFRNPKDSIASWHKYPSNGLLESDIKYYVRFYSFVLDNLNKVVLMDFDNFTQDIEYIKSQVSANYNLRTDSSVTNDEVKMAMLVNGKEINLPRNNKAELDLIKASLESMPEFTECIDLYARLKQI